MDSIPYLTASDGLPARKSGKWAKRKHHYLGNYCGITTVPHAEQRFKLIYLDVMAGPGLCKLEDNGEEFPGSPLVALEHDFAEYILIEDSKDWPTLLRSAFHVSPRKHIKQR